MINRFSQFLIEEDKAVYFTFGRMNPPTIGHGKLLDKLAALSGKYPYKVFLSHSQDPSKNPLSYSNKIKHVRKMFPKHARNIMVHKEIKTAMDAVVDLYEQGFRKIVMVVGSDRVTEFETLIMKYNGKEARHGFYNFQDIKVVSAGERDPDAEGVEGMSASKLRAAAKDNDFIAFSQGVPQSINTKDTRKLFNDVRKGMGLSEEAPFKNHVALKPVSEVREAFVQGQLYGLGDKVVIKESEEVATVVVLGANYVIVETADNRKMRKWLDAIELIEATDRWYKDQPEEGTPEAAKKAKQMTPQQEGLWANIHARRKKGLPPKKPGDEGYPKTLNIEAAAPQDPDIKDRAGTQPAKYHAGLSTAMKVARDRQFKKQSKMADDDPNAYKPAPGDKTAKTIPSKYTKFVQKMVGEEAVMQLEGSFADKSKASGISSDTLRKVYNRGVAAWKTGHRPGTTPQQWGHARVNAFIAKKKKGTLNHDKDLA